MAVKRRDERWMVDRHVPVTLIATLMLQFAGGIWYASQITTRITDIEKQLSAAAPQESRLTKLETKFEAVLDKLSDIKVSVDRLGSWPPGSLQSSPATAPASAVMQSRPQKR